MGIKYFLRLVLIVTGIVYSMMVSSLAFASQYQEAVKATSERDYDRAMVLWQKLARQGNPVAQYNLAVFYKEGYGTTANRNKSTNFLKTAMKQGLIEASMQVNSNSIQPANKRAVDKVIEQYKSNTLSASLLLDEKPTTSQAKLNDPVGWVKAQNPRHYTLQLASSRSEKGVKKVYEENNMKGKAGYYKKVRDGKTWYFLIYGAYSTSGEATSKISELPEELRKSSPWVRKLKNIQRVVSK